MEKWRELINKKMKSSWTYAVKPTVHLKSLKTRTKSKKQSYQASTRPLPHYPSVYGCPWQSSPHRPWLRSARSSPRHPGLRHARSSPPRRPPLDLRWSLLPCAAPGRSRSSTSRKYQLTAALDRKTANLGTQEHWDGHTRPTNKINLNQLFILIRELYKHIIIMKKIKEKASIIFVWI
jgi:hypothetical protein